MERDTQPGELPRLSKIVEMKLPLTWLLGVAFMIVAGGFGLYQQVGSQGEVLKELKDQLKDLKITVNAGNSQAATIQGEIAILRFRIETIESDKRSGR
ncbi:MAG TPA: hypothetical protein VJ889_20230 [Pseudomonas sp.]|nr:hypothetical protein [Pseudomonas sp.]